jgi:L-ascorbate metabolism protein UlaG (beta-lactamase superfamily)
MKRYYVIAACLALVFAWLPLQSQEPAKSPYVSSARRALTAPELLDAPDEWLQRSLGWANEILNAFPPAVPEHPVRRAALIRLDDILHIEKAPEKPLVQQFFRSRIRKAIGEIEATRVSEGMRVWKLYNHGFLVRTASVSFAFDIVPGTGTPGFSLDPPDLERLTAQSDALLITHLHADHANREVAKLFLARGKPVIAPEGLWSNEPELSKSLTHLERSTKTMHEVRLQGGRLSLKIVVYPGHQGTVINNVYLVATPEGLTVLHTGDQSGSEEPGGDFDWIANIGYSHQVDILLPNCWTDDIDRVVRGVNPRLVITGHENEMGHTVDHREDYTQTYNRLFGTRYPFIVMTWGESYHYRR